MQYRQPAIRFSPMVQQQYMNVTVQPFQSPTTRTNGFAPKFTQIPNTTRQNPPINLTTSPPQYQQPKLVTSVPAQPIFRNGNTIQRMPKRNESQGFIGESNNYDSSVIVGLIKENQDLKLKILEKEQLYEKIQDEIGQYEKQRI